MLLIAGCIHQIFNLNDSALTKISLGELIDKVLSKYNV